VDVLELLNKTVQADTKVYQDNIRRSEKEAVRDWQRFVCTSKSEGMEIDKVLTEIAKDHDIEITV
jgi:DNA primase catalytic subunit